MPIQRAAAGRDHESYEHSPMQKPLLSPEDLATLLSVPLATVYGWRSRGEGPVGCRIGKHVRFKLADVERWLDRCRDGSGRRG